MSYSVFEFILDALKYGHIFSCLLKMLRRSLLWFRQVLKGLANSIFRQQNNIFKTFYPHLNCVIMIDWALS